MKTSHMNNQVNNEFSWFDAYFILITIVYIGWRIWVYSQRG